MQRLALLVAACGFAAGAEPEPHRSNQYVYQQTHITSATQYHYIGESRKADLNYISLVNGCATVGVHLMYAERASADWCADPDNQCTCLTQTTSADCMNVKTASIIESAAIASGSHMQFNAHGRSEYSFFMVIKVSGFGSIACTTADITITVDVAVTNVDSAYCVRPVDMTHQLQKSDSVEYFNTDASMPYHPGKRFELSTKTAGSPSTETSLSATPNVIYYNLGRSPQVELECLNVHITSSHAAAAAGCGETQLLPVNTQPADVNVELLGVADCNAFIDVAPTEFSMCCGASKDVCLAGVTNGTCLWDGDSNTCYTTWGMHTTNLAGAVNTAGVPFVFASNRVHGPQSTYVSNVESLPDWTGDWNRRWLLAITNMMVPTSTGSCDISVSTSFQSTTTGGLCEPTTRKQCDTTMDGCLATVPADQPRFWKQYETYNTSFEEEYSTCNCLKQKEVCYRKGGCVSTKKYQLILQNCLDQGCGNYCNSGAGMVASMLVTVLAVLAVML